MRSFSYLLFIPVFIILCFNQGCKKKNSQKESPEVDKKSMVSNIGNNIIIPNYQILKIAVDKLDSATTAFNLNPDLTNLNNLQLLFKDAYLKWQLCSSFEFGPAETEYLRININTFPTDTNLINSNISSGSYDLNTIVNQKSKGFPGIDFLLNGTGSDNNEILLKYTTDANSANRKLYLAALTANLKSKVINVLNGWISSGGNYINTFINSDGTDIGSSLGLLVNQVDYDLEVLKNYKLGVPLGKQSAGTIYPEKTEAYYGGFSIELAVMNLQAIENIYLGKSNLGDGLGFDDYLEQIGAQYNGASLSATIKNQFTTCLNKLQQVQDPLSSSIQNNASIVDAAYIEIQKLVVLLKTDMPSEMGILITFNDADGD